MVVSGAGFSQSTMVYICGELCDITEDVAADELTCSTPPFDSKLAL